MVDNGIGWTNTMIDIKDHLISSEISSDLTVAHGYCMNITV